MTENSPALDIRLFVTDVDGTLTDGGMYYTADGDHMKRFNTRDGMGLSMLREAGIEVAMMTSEDSRIVLRRAEKLNITHVFVGVADKSSRLEGLCDSLNIPMDRVAYVGDDLNDLQVMKRVGLAIAVADADSRIVEVSQVRLTKRGGEGAVREAAEWVLSRQAVRSTIGNRSG